MIEEEEPNWFTMREEELPSAEELMPLSQSLITPDLALALDIPTPNPSASAAPGLNATSPRGGDDLARTLKRPRLVWTPQLHKRFVDAVAHLGIKNAVPKTIMQLMSVDGLTRENVASHLQKYRLYLKRMQGLSSAGPPCPMAPPLLQHHQHIPAAAALAQQQFYHHRQLFGSPMATGGDYHNGFQTRTGGFGLAAPSNSCGEAIDSGSGGGRRVLTLFPSTGEDGE